MRVAILRDPSPPDMPALLGVPLVIDDAFLRTRAKNGGPRYVVRCGIVDARHKRRVAVWDALGGWVCSTHTTIKLAEKRAAELNGAR